MFNSTRRVNASSGSCGTHYKILQEQQEVVLSNKNEHAREVITTQTGIRNVLL